MTKFSHEQSRQIDQAVKETIVKRLTYLEALDYIKATLGYSINAKTYFIKKAKVKQMRLHGLIDYKRRTMNTFHYIEIDMTN